jgi:chromosome transmission fidelity protein 1
MISAAELLMDLKLDNINLFKVLSYLDHSRLPQKLLGFTNAITAKLVISEDCGISKHVSSLSVVQTFLAKMTCTSQEGKIVTDWPRANADSRSSAARHPTLRFVALHPALHFRDVVSEARAVALVGGTIRPFSHVATELLDSNFLSFAANADNMVLDDGKVSAAYSSQLLAAFTCDHVVPASNVLLECLSTGPSNISLDFRHQSRNTDSVMDELGRVVVQFVQTVPAGIVMFLPSYAYEAQVVRRWKARGIWSEIQRFKRVHREPKQRQHVETTLEAYSRDAKEHGALLLSVVGGKMSEGINFANEMARCVVVVGLPYPDITDPELKEKMKTMDQIPSGISGQAYYHNLCMRAVNQSVGRAIRHEKDYAVVILVDQRYSTDTRVWNALPEWLKRGGKTDRNHQFDESKERLARFFDDRRAASEDML